MGRFVWLLVGSLALASMSRADERPNVVILLADDLGYSDLGCYGSEIETPHLDRLAADGMRFTRFYNTGRCWPTRAALLTGYYAQQVGRDVLPGDPRLRVGRRPDWAPLLPKLLEPLGYRCYHTGKWHIDGSPVAAGFQHSYQIEDHDRYFHPQRVLVDDKPAPPIERGSVYYSTTEIASRAVEQLKTHAEQTPDSPFLCYVAFLAPHFPLQAPERDIAKYRDRYRDGWDQVRAARFARQHKMGLINCGLSEPERGVGPPYHFPNALGQLGSGEVNRPLPWDELTLKQQEFQAAKMAIHAAMIDRMDQEIGRIVMQLREMNAFENTLLLFLSDNGASAEIMIRGDGHDRAAPPGSAESYLCLGPGWSTCCNTPFRRHKTWVHEGGISTPLIAHWPAGIANPGRLCDEPGHVIDIVPTVLQIAGAGKSALDPPIEPYPGLSIVGLLRGETGTPARSLWWLHEANRAMLSGNDKLVASGDNAEWEFFDMRTDRSESRDLSQQKVEEVRRLDREWSTLRDNFRQKLLESQP